MGAIVCAGVAAWQARGAPRWHHGCPHQHRHASIDRLLLLGVSSSLLSGVGAARLSSNTSKVKRPELSPRAESRAWLMPPTFLTSHRLAEPALATQGDQELGRLGWGADQLTSWIARIRSAGAAVVVLLCACQSARAVPVGPCRGAAVEHPHDLQQSTPSVAASGRVGLG
jgi:hypothetical protein